MAAAARFYSARPLQDGHVRRRPCGGRKRLTAARSTPPRSRNRWKNIIPTLAPGDVVVMDNLPARKGARVGELIKAAGAELRYLPPYTAPT